MSWLTWLPCQVLHHVDANAVLTHLMGLCLRTFRLLLVLLGFRIPFEVKTLRDLHYLRLGIGHPT